MKLLAGTHGIDVNGRTVSYSAVYLNEKPFLRSHLPPLQSESKCKVFVMVISSTIHMNEN